MGMFDTFYVQDRNRSLDVQSKQFACVLNGYRLGDFVTFEAEPPRGVQTYIEDYRHNYIDPDCPLEWIVLLLVDGCFLDAYVAESEAVARNSADVMVKLWQSPERQAEAFRRHARAHYVAWTTQRRALSRVSNLLHDYAEWQERKAQGEEDTSPFRCIRHDFDREGWDWAVARLLLDLPEFREHVPACYALARELEAGNGSAGQTS